MSQENHQAGAYPAFNTMKLLGLFLLPLDGMLVHHRVTPPPSIKFSGTHLWRVPIYGVEQGTVRVKCFPFEHNTMPLARG